MHPNFKSHHFASLICIIAVLLLTDVYCTPEGENEVDHGHAHGKVTGLDSEAVRDLSLRNTRFAMEMFTFVRERTKKSFFFSPFSVSSMLAMAYLGTGGNTRDEIGRVLGLDDLDNPHDIFRQTIELMLSHNDHFTLLIANGLFARSDFVYKQEYNDAVQQYYQAGMEELDIAGDVDGSRQYINNWVMKQTQSKIPNLLAPGTIDELTHLILVNAIYFQSQWKYPFLPGKTKRANFTMINGEVREIDMMVQRGAFPYLSLSDYSCSLIELPYKGDHMSMFVLLPESVEYSRIMERHLTGDKLIALLKKPRPETQVDIMLPRFNISIEMNLKAFLQKKGINDLFDPNSANLTEITDETQLSFTEVFHKSYLNVYENGTEAAAASAGVIVGTSASLPSPVVFNADHPFAFIIRENPTETILFAGRYMGPDQNGKKFGKFAANLAREPNVGQSLSGGVSLSTAPVIMMVCTILCVILLNEERR